MCDCCYLLIYTELFISQVDRHTLDKVLKTRVAAEPKLILLRDESGQLISSFLVCDSLTVCKWDGALCIAVELLLSAFFLLNINYSANCSQIMGIIQQVCLGVAFPVKERKTGFTELNQLCLHI
jgi:hypothetical protein